MSDERNISFTVLVNNKGSGGIRVKDQSWSE